jgi:hypothetical protein
MLGLSVCSQAIEGSLKICTSYLVYSHIWLNLRDDGHFFYTVLSGFFFSILCWCSSENQPYEYLGKFGDIQNIEKS